MSRWICIDDICIPSDENDWEELVAFADMVAEQEPINIVRCKECKHRESCCRPCYKSADSYCSDGEREDEPQTCEECEHWNDTEDGCADRHGCKTESSSEKPNNCDTCRFELYCPEMCEGCCEWDSHYEPKDESQTERGDE